MATNDDITTPVSNTDSDKIIVKNIQELKRSPKREHVQSIADAFRSFNTGHLKNDRNLTKFTVANDSLDAVTENTKASTIADIFSEEIECLRSDPSFTGSQNQIEYLIDILSL